LKDTDLRTAVVGLGKMGLVHAGILNVLPNSRVVAICEKNALVRRFAKKIFKEIEIVADAEMLVGLNLDSVHVTTPIPSHFNVTKTVLTKKIASNVFVEKTLAQNYEESSQLSELAHSLASVNMVGYLRRFYVTFNKAKTLLSQGKIGDVTSFKAYAYSSDFVEVGRNNNAPLSRGGVLRDLGCHVVDLTLWLFGPLKVSCVESKPDSSCRDSVNFKVENPKLEGDIKVSWLMSEYRLPEVGFSIIGSKGQLTVNDDQVKLEATGNEPVSWYRHDLDDSVPFLLGLPEYYREDYHFVKSILESSRAEPDFRQASEVDKIIDDVEKRAGDRVQTR
jgi:predicted dehydrogenase